jgi:hypothetical protein
VAKARKHGPAQTAGDLAAESGYAQTNDLPFVSLMDAAGTRRRNGSMIQRSGMETNYLGRLRKDSATQARMDYHDEDRNCHFQVDLQQEGADWKVRRIYFCK